MNGTSYVFIIFEIVVLLFSAILHEIAHGFMAEKLGDDTARRAGHLTLNPLVHIDPFGSIILPIALLVTSSFVGFPFVFAYAKPVPYNPRNLKHPRSGSAEIALAGPATNLGLALVFGIFSILLPIANATKSGMVAMIAGGNTITFQSPLESIYFLFLIIVYINILLAIFNLVPIPPLDGSRVLFAALPPSRTTFRVAYFLERYGFILVLFSSFSASDC